jgi:hypothetical protein
VVVAEGEAADEEGRDLVLEVLGREGRGEEKKGTGEEDTDG